MEISFFGFKKRILSMVTENLIDSSNAQRLHSFTHAQGDRGAAQSERYEEQRSSTGGAICGDGGA